jgi:hypothetical protein
MSSDVRALWRQSQVVGLCFEVSIGAKLRWRRNPMDIE